MELSALSLILLHNITHKYKSQDRLVVCTTSRPEHIMINGHASNIGDGRVVLCRLKVNTHNIINYIIITKFDPR